MKQFAVLQKIGSFGATVVREFDDEKSASQFATLLKESEETDYTTFHVVKVLTPLAE